MNGTATRLRVLAACVWWLAGWSAFGRVYWVGRGPSHGPTTAGQPGWNQAYKSRLRINEGHADLEVLGVSLPAPEAERTLVAAYRAMGADVWAVHGTSIGWGIALEGTRVVRWLVFPVSGPRECIVVRLTQTREELHASARLPRGEPIPSLPPAPTITTTLFLADDSARASTQIGHSALPSLVAANRLADDLVQAGWQLAIPAAPDAPPLLFRRGRELCAVLVVPREDGGSRVLRLHKVLGADEQR